MHSYEDLEIHHPSKKGKEPGRHYQVVDGHNQEVLSSGGKVTHSKEGHVFVSKDFILLNDKGSKEGLRTPAPAEGYIKIEKNSGLVKIYDKLPDGEMIAQVRHMDLRGSGLKDGDHIKYGQPMGIQSGMGGGKLDAYPTHTHIDFNANHLDKLKQYIRDIDSGVITADRYPAKGQVTPAPVTAPVTSHERPAAEPVKHAPPRASADGVLRSGEQGAEIRALQESLNKLGYHDGKGHALKPDADFGASTKQALQAFQRAHGLTDDGIAGPKTLGALKKAEQTPLLSNPAHPDHAMFKQAVGGLEKLGPQAGFKSHAELERAAATLTFEAKVGGLNRIDHVALSTNGTGLFAVQGGLTDPGHHRAHVDKAQAGAQPLEQSTFQMQQDAQQRQKLEQAPAVAQQQREARVMA
ncbi:peptidoglycan-binding domain-containing protein [Lysobacter sp. cf310]|uniref:peptidoglycan-binding domain-containing protein n=1 Tax=Lysobacter sp. cf310 TaxID=1761790 RepID=UPI000B80F037|nr:peptidoglycan-binding domain-containing protein [Lysobacter sp. cf310]